MALAKSKDPIGKAIRDYFLNGEAEKLWVYSDISEIDEIPVSYLFRNYKAMPKLEQIALKNCAGNVLDVGAAAGSHSLWLTENDIKVKAIDISGEACNVMQQRGVCDVETKDFFKLVAPQKFDTLLFLMNGIGIVGTIDGLPKFFKKCKQLLAKNGCILLDSSDIAYMFDDEDEKPEGKYYGEVSYIMRYGDVISDRFSWLFIDFNTLEQEAEKHGFKCEKLAEGENYNFLTKLTSK